MTKDEALLLAALEKEEVARRAYEISQIVNIGDRTPAEVAQIRLAVIKARVAYEDARVCVAELERKIAPPMF